MCNDHDHGHDDGAGHHPQGTIPGFVTNQWEVGADYASVGADGRLRIVKWGHILEDGDLGTFLNVGKEPRPEPMHGSVATGMPLVSNGSLGADVIRLPAGKGFAPHTHPGDHLLICIAGHGTISFDGFIYPTHAGEVYMVPGAVPHAVGAITDHAILAVGSPHMPVNSPDRMKPIAYKSVAAEMGTLTCLICGKVAHYPALLHDEGCPHCCCPVCAGVPESGYAADDLPPGGHHAP